MSEYCSQCSPFTDEYEIDLFKITIKLKNGRSESFFCEGCNNRGLYKDEIGKLYLAKKEKDEINLQPVNIEDLVKTK